MIGYQNSTIHLQAQMLLNRIKGSHIGLSAGGILKLNSDTIVTVSITLWDNVEFNDVYIRFVTEQRVKIQKCEQRYVIYMHDLYIYVYILPCILLQTVGLIITYFVIVIQFGQSELLCGTTADVGNSTTAWSL